MLPTAPFPAIQYVDQPRTDAQCARGELRLLVLSDAVYIALVGADGHLLACKRIVNAQAMLEEVFLRYVLEREPLLHSHYARIQICHSSTPFALVPEGFMRTGNDRLLLGRLLLDETALPTELHSAELPSLRAKALFQVPQQAETVFSEYLPEARHSHLGELVTVQALRLAQEHPHFIYLYLLPDGVVAAVCREGRLLLCNRYPCSFSADVRYYVQALFNSLLPDRLYAPVLLAGEFEQGGKLHTELKSWFPSLQTPTLLARQVRDVAQPFWRYAVLAG